MISVALCTYNGEAFLREQLDSLATQSRPPAELQVGDDRSTDATLDILADFRSRAPFPVHVHVNERRLGYGENFIATARRCSAPWIAFCDQDDVWFPHKLERCAAELREGVTLVAHSAEVTGDQRLPDWPARPVNPPLSLMPRWFCLGFCQAFDRRILDVPKLDLPWVEVEDAHDAWVPFIAGMTGTIVWIDEPLARYRSHRDNVSRTLGGKPGSESDATDYMTAASRIAAELGFDKASAHYARCADWLRRRRAVREQRSVTDFVRLLSSGAYRGGGYERFGKRAMLDDLRTLFTG